MPRPIGEEKADRQSDIVGRSDAFQRNGIDHALVILGVLKHGPHHRRLDPAGSDGVDADPRAQFARQSLGERDLAAL